jgi:hypothetical protein
MAQKITEGLFVIAIVGLVLSNGAAFGRVEGSMGTQYASLVRGLRPSGPVQL